MVRAGRSRDSTIDERVLQAAGRQLATSGFTAMSLSAVAREAGTTRQAIARRWSSKAELAAAVVVQVRPEPSSERAAFSESVFVDPYGDLVAELADFAAGVSGPGRLFLVGTMLQDTTDSSVRMRYRAEVVAPRQRRIQEILEQAARLDLIDADADFALAATLATGSWYAWALAGDPVPADWAARTAALVWRAVGGTHPDSPQRVSAGLLP